jgi:hypothetical protein
MTVVAAALCRRRAAKRALGGLGHRSLVLGDHRKHRACWFFCQRSVAIYVFDALELGCAEWCRNFC